MKLWRRRSIRWAALAAALAAVAVAFVYVRARMAPALPVAQFFPAEPSAVVAVRDFDAAWRRHWDARGVEPGAALEHILTLTGTLPRWEKKHGAAQAKLRVGAWSRLVNTVLTDEAWFLFGDWNGGAGGEAKPGMVLLVRTRDPLAQQAGPIAELLLGDYDIKHSDYRGVTLYCYNDETQRRNVTFCRLGGWIAASMRLDGAGPLTAMIDRHLDDAPAPGASPEAFSATGSGVAGAWISPAKLCDHIETFNAERGKNMSKEMRRKLERWRKIGQGGAAFSVRQDGANLFALTASFIGPAFVPPGDLTLDAAPESAPGGSEAWPSLLAQVQWTGALERAVASLSADQGMNELIEKMSDNDIASLFVPLVRQVTGASTDAGELCGMGFFGAPGGFVPGVLAWRDVPPRRASDGLPAPMWAGTGNAGNDGDAARWVMGGAAAPGEARDGQSPLAASWRRARREAFDASPAPLLCLSVETDAVREFVAAYPAIVAGKKRAGTLESAVKVCDVMSFVIGPGLGLRLAPAAGHWELSVFLP